MEVELIVDPPGAGAWNMAVDEMLLESAARDGRRVLRFYQWAAPTLSLGYFQRLSEREGHAESGACAVVRRATGGGAILHDCELTYSFAAPEQGLGGHQALYDLFHETLVEWLTEQGVEARRYESPTEVTCGEATASTAVGEPFLCFQRRAHGDVVAWSRRGAEPGEFKVCGSAQRRWKSALLQHGSLLLRRSSCAPQLPGVWELAGLASSPSEVWRAWSERLARRTGWTWRETTISPVESASATRLQFERYGTHSWTGRRA
ncbi:MAG: hypothetical protein U0939_00785 [Pirellulales bacterium]